MLVSHANSRMTSLTSARLTLDSFTNPPITPTCSSMGRLISFSTSSGAAPGYSVRTVRVGYVSSGINVTGSRRYEKDPKTTAAINIMRIATGRDVMKLLVLFGAVDSTDCRVGGFEGESLTSHRPTILARSPDLRPMTPRHLGHPWIRGPATAHALRA